MGTEITWVGEGVEEYGHVKGDAENIMVRVDPRYFRPTEVELLLVSRYIIVQAEPSPANVSILLYPSRVCHMRVRLLRGKKIVVVRNMRLFSIAEGFEYPGDVVWVGSKKQTRNTRVCVLPFSWH